MNGDTEYTITLTRRVNDASKALTEAIKLLVGEGVPSDRSTRQGLRIALAQIEKSARTANSAIESLERMEFDAA
jgi:hypothetical protein